MQRTAGQRSRLATRRATRLRGPAVDARRADVKTALWASRPGPLLDAVQKDWVSRGGALTRHFSLLGPVSVRVAGEGIGRAWRDEVQVLKGREKRTWTREVVLSVGDVPVVVAHSATRLAASRSQWKAMRTLRTRPLADLLYHDRTVQRSLLVSRRCRSGQDDLQALVSRAGLPAGQGAPRVRTRFVARRSLFARGREFLMITECFLPAFWDLVSRG